MNKSHWNKNDWSNMRQKLERLDASELLSIAKSVGISFDDEKNLKDRPEASIKEQIILVLDESSPAELHQAYAKLLGQKI